MGKIYTGPELSAMTKEELELAILEMEEYMKENGPTREQELLAIERMNIGIYNDKGELIGLKEDSAEEWPEYN